MGWDGQPPISRFDPNFRSQKNKCNYWEFTRELYPDPPLSAGKQARLAMKKKRSSVNVSFTNKGQPGAGLRKFFEKGKDIMSGLDAKDLHIVPAFYDLIIALTKAKRTFSICFRTFGIDLDKI